MSPRKSIRNTSLSSEKTLRQGIQRCTAIAFISILTACAGSPDTDSKNDTATADEVRKVVIPEQRQVRRDKLELNETEADAVVIASSESISHAQSAPKPAPPYPSLRSNTQLGQTSSFAVYDSADPYLPANRENYASVDESAVQRTDENPVSTFSIDVDTGSYTNVRRMLNQGYLPPADAVRVEEFINYFDYDYKTPRSSKDPFRVNTELSHTPWNPDSLLLRVGLKAFEVEAEDRPDANLVFLLDVSGSMNSPDKLPLLKQSFRMLSKNLTANDRVSIVVYAGASGVVLEPTPGNEQRSILNALARLRAGGSTNGAAGINLAYQLAEDAFIENGINRILIATDGDFNVGTSGVDALKRLIEDKRKKGISFTTLGFGSGNYNDHLMEQLADVGNGNHAYIDSVREAEKVLVTEMSSTLMTVAKDVKIQVEFNPATVSEYRLIGYENRALKREDFNNDKVDAGEIGAGHTVTAIYEIFPVGEDNNIDPLRYNNENKTLASKLVNELAFVKLRFKYPDADKSTLRDFPVESNQLIRFDQASQEFKFAVAVAAFGQKLKRSKYLNEYSLADIAELADYNKGEDRYGYREEFVGLVSMADSLLVSDGHIISESDH